MVLEGISSDFSAVNIRKFIVRATRLSELVELGSLTGPAARFLEAAVLAGLNIVVAGGTRSGAEVVDVVVLDVVVVEDVEVVVVAGGALTWTAPRSHGPERTSPRWSVAGQSSPAPRTGEPAWGAMVCVGPPLSARGESRGSTPTRSPLPESSGQSASAASSRLRPPSASMAQ